ncbi:hypothetical protein HMI49_01840 [Corallococcus exercitus]|uniref:STAS domain-containing protein n=1 Tax=Corallococcus exercitus TaxID=2316736 RepID=A0A7Y4NP39_9BACT|nr:hypothetical protein [Corallococcus exercitus]NOK31944.1 hypothetical protein [Corallococcus exercitus]
MHLEAPDVLWVDFNGATNLDDAKRLLSIVQEVAVDGPVFVVVDIDGSVIDKAAREYFSKESSPERLRGVIYVGTQRLQMASAKAVAFALYLTGRLKGDVEFVTSGQAARELIERKRAKAGAAR